MTDPGEFSPPRVDPRQTQDAPFPGLGATGTAGSGGLPPAPPHRFPMQQVDLPVYSPRDRAVWPWLLLLAVAVAVIVGAVVFLLLR